MIVSSTARAQLKHSLKVALPFQISWVVAAVIILLAGGSVNLMLLVFLIPLLWVPAALELIAGGKMPDALQIHFHAFITASSVMGSTFGVYDVIPHWDTLVHIDSGILLAWLGMFVVRRAEEEVKVRLPLWFAVTAPLATPLAFAALWEVCEFLSDTFMNTTTQFGLEDSIIDMAAAVVGALIAVVAARWWAWPKSVLPAELREPTKKRRA